MPGIFRIQASQVDPDLIFEPGRHGDSDRRVPATEGLSALFCLA